MKISTRFNFLSIYYSGCIPEWWWKFVRNSWLKLVTLTTKKDNNDSQNLSEMNSLTLLLNIPFHPHDEWNLVKSCRDRNKRAWQLTSVINNYIFSVESAINYESFCCATNIKRGFLRLNTEFIVGIKLWIADY